MATGQMLSDDLLAAESAGQSCYPLDSSRLLLGLMALSRRAEATEADPEDGGTLEGVISRGVLRSLLSALHFRDERTVRHSRRVAMLAVGMAEFLGWEGRDLKVLEIAGLLHDIGKIGVPDNVLFKPGKLSADEAELMALHYHIGIDVLQACRADTQVLEIVSHAHRYYNVAVDGSRSVGNDIPQGARILAVADAYDSLRTDQVYREGKPHDEILKILTESSGTQFDGNIVSALSRWLEEEDLPFEKEPDEESSQTHAAGSPRTEETLEAGSLGQIFSYLYVLESLYDGFYLVDSDLRFLVWNDGVQELLGHPSQEMLGRVWTSRLLSYADPQGNPLDDDQCPTNRVIATGRPNTAIIRVRTHSGQWIDVELQSVPLLDDQKRLHGVAEIFRNVNRTTRRPREFRELKMAASRDALTSVANRGELETQLAVMVSEYGRSENAEPFSVIFLDVDHFKAINDTYGHGVGDQVLIDLARLLQHETYSGELVGRYGGEEFVILCPGTDMEQAVRRAERLRVAVLNGQVGGISDDQVSISLGITQSEPGDSVESVLRRADKALYQAKETGRNRCCRMTHAQLLSGKPVEETGNETQPDPFVYSATFSAFVAADMVIYKLGGFVNEQNARLVEVTQQRAVIRVGTRGLLPFWGSTPDRQPVEMIVEFGNEETPNLKALRAPARQVSVKLQMRPLGRVRDAAVFQNRAATLFKLLRSYFAAM